MGSRDVPATPNTHSRERPMRIPSTLELALALFTVLTTTAAAQRNPPRVLAAPAPAADTGILIRAAGLPQRAAIPFRAFPRTDSAGRPLTQAELNAVITLPNGRTMTRAAFFDSADALERRLNATGHSLRATGDTALAGLTSNATVLRQQRARTQALPGGRSAPLRRADLLERRTMLSQLHAADHPMIALIAPRVRLPNVLAGGPWKAMPATKQWGSTFDFGQPSTVEAKLAYSGQIVGDTLGTSVSAGTTLDGWLLGAHRTLLQVTANAAAPLSNANGHASFTVLALGNSVYSKTATTSTYTAADTFSVPLDYHVDGHWSIGPVPVSLTLGTRGDASLAYDLSASPGAVLGSVTPAADLEGYGDADIDLWIASGGIGVDLTFIKGSLPVSGDIAIVNNPTQGLFGLHREFHADLNLDALSGDINLHAKVYTPCLTGICSHRYSTDIFKWDGFVVNKNLVTFNDFWSFRSPLIVLNHP